MISQLTQGRSRLMAPSCGCPDFGGGDESGSWFDASVKIERQPNDASEYDGSKVIFSVKASGVGPLVYRWQYCATESGDYADVPGGFLRVLEIASMSASIVGFYRCVVSNPSGKSATSRSASLERLVHVPPQITQQPIGGTYKSGTVKSLSISAIGSSPLSYQWYINGLPISGGTAAGYSFVVSDSSVGSYNCVVTNKFGTATSSTAGVLAIDENTLLLVQVDESGDIVEKTGNGTISIAGTVAVDHLTTRDGYGSIRNTEAGSTASAGRVEIATNILLDGDFTVEGYWNPLAYALTYTSAWLRTNDGLIALMSSTTIPSAARPAVVYFFGFGGFPFYPNNFYHIAIVRHGSDVRFYVGGELGQSGSQGSSLSISNLNIGGGYPDPLLGPGCCWENIRVSNIARYVPTEENPTGSFTPPGRF